MVANRLLSLLEHARAHVNEIELAEFANIEPSSVLLLDVREDSEWADGHIPGAIHLSKGLLECQIEKLVPDADTPMVLYCGGGVRSLIAAFNLHQMGYTNVLSLAGGWKHFLAEQKHLRR